MALKLGDFYLFNRHLFSLFRIFLLTKSRDYIVSSALSLWHFEYLRVTKHKVFKALLSDLPSFVEEIGESAFGILGTALGNSSEHYDFSYVRDSWKLLHPFIQQSRAFSSSLSSNISKSSTIDIGESTLDTQLLHSFLVQLIEELRHQRFCPYRKSYQSKCIPPVASAEFESPHFKVSECALDVDVAYSAQVAEETVENFLFKLLP